LKDFGAQAFGQAQHIDGAMNAGLGGLDWIVLVVDGGGGTGQIIDLIGFDIERKSHIVPDHLETVMIEHALDVAPCAGEIIVDANDVGTLLEQALAKMRAEKSSTSSD
jgi:hypothetical protein